MCTALCLALVPTTATADTATVDAATAESYLPPADSPLAPVRPTMQGFHLWNVKMTYLELTAQ